MRVLGFVALAIVSLTGCGDDGGEVERPPDAPSLRDGPYADTLGALCDLLDRCPEVLGGVPIAHRNREECKLILDFGLACELVEAREGDFTVRRRPIDLSAEEAEACIGWLESVSCDAFGGEDDSPCAAVLSFGEDDGSPGSGGEGRLNDSCSSDDMCGSELYCSGGGIDPDRAVSICEVCRPRLTEGEPCTTLSARICAEGLYCRFVDDMPRSCQPPQPNEARCIENEECASGYCNSDRDPLGGRGICDESGNVGDPCERTCRYENYCNGGTCAARRPSGEACTDGEQCLAFLCNDDRICGAPDGQGCRRDEDCASRRCAGGVCGGSSDGSCFDDEQCPDGQLCNFDTDRCVEPQPDGAPCRRDEECRSDFCTDDDRCGARPSVGDPCTSFSGDCALDAYCSQGRCALRAAPGEACDSLEACQLPFLCQGGRCRLPNLACMPARAGEPCALLRVCDDDSWCDFVGGVVCRSRFGIGEECQASPVPGVRVCAAGSLCLADETGTSRCLAQAREGDGCGAGSIGCAEGLACVEGTCMPAGDVGRPCDDFGDPCPAPLFCDRRETCQAPGGEGADCADQDECVEGYYCDSTCTTKKPMGAECRDTFECQDDLWCNTLSGDRTETCVADLVIGSECDSREQPCAAGSYCPPGLTTCTAFAADGDDCSSDEECLSGVCEGICLASAMCVLPD